MKTIDFSYFIERYIAGEMDEAEKQWFINEMEGNINLRKEVEVRRKTDQVLKNRDLLNLRNKLDSIEKERAKGKPVKPRRKQPALMYAAIITVVVIIGSIFLLSRSGPDTSEILDKYNQTYEATTAMRSDGMVGSSDFSLALEYYEIHDYRNAAIYFSKAIEAKPEDLQSTLLHGISNYEVSNYPEAKRSLVKVIDDNKNLYIDHARWYFALCQIKTNEDDSAVEQLAIINNSHSIYRKDAKKLLKSLTKRNQI